METRPDRDLVRAVNGGDSEAFAYLVHRYRSTYTRFAVRMLGNREDAEDVLQLAFVRAFRALHRCEDPERFAAWLYQIVVNECRTYLSRRTRRERRFLPDAEAADPATDHPWAALGEQDEILQAVAQLSIEQREAFLLKHVEELSYEEMNELTGVGESALKMRVKRACERLRELLEQVSDERV
jgi:RNA polymerase sigma-70 factor, ECF subfamily